MLRIECPWCGARDETEFSYGGEADLVRPPDPAALDDADWAAYLFVRQNPRGGHAEQWCHSAGCRRWLVVRRDTISNDISAVRRPDDGTREAAD